MLLGLKKEHILGLGVCVALAILSKEVAQIIPSLGSTSFAIILGIIFGNVLTNTNKMKSGIIFAEKKMLPIAIMLLGVTLNIEDVFKIGPKGLLYICIVMVNVIIFSIFLGNKLGFTKKFSMLLGAGNAVCGSSAIAATSQVIDAKEEEVGISVAVVNLMGTITMFILPILATKVLNFNNLQSGALIGGSLQSVGQVVASGGMVNDEVQVYATLFKMIRVVMLGAVVLSYTYIEGSEKKETNTTKSKTKIPYFIKGFFALSILVSLKWIPNEGIDVLKGISKWFLLTAMAGIGMKIKLKELITEGPKAILAGIIISIFQITLTTTLIFILL